MYISKYWGEYIGGTDDSLTLVAYLEGKQKEEIPLGEIFSDTGLDKLNGSFQKTDTFLEVVDLEEYEMEFHYAIDLLTDLAALLLECKMNGCVNLYDLDEDVEPDCVVRITATPEEHELINKTLMDFSATPLAYDLSEMVPEEDMIEMAAICEALRKELYE